MMANLSPKGNVAMVTVILGALAQARDFISLGLTLWLGT